MQSVMEGMMKNVLCGLVLALFVLTVAAVHAAPASPRKNCQNIPSSWFLSKVPVFLQPTTLPWCTVASVEMAYAFYGKTYDQFKQCELVSLHTGKTCCPDYLTMDTPEDCYLSAFWPENWFQMSPPFKMHYQEVYHVEGRDNDPPALLWQDVKDQIYCKNLPFLFIWSDEDGSPSHTLIAVGYSEEGGQFVGVNDPITGYSSMPYDVFVNGLWGGGHFEDYTEIYPLEE
jgi:hypothetical protein